MFKKKPIKYNNSVSNLKKSFSNNESNRPVNKQRNSYSYLLNKSEPLYFTPQINNKNIAYLMTPCYLVDNDEINNKNINEFNKKYGRDIINGFNGYYISYPNKDKTFFRNKSSEILNNSDPFFNVYMRNVKNDINKKRNRNNDKYSTINKIQIPFDYKNQLFNREIKPFGNFIKSINNKRPISSEKRNMKQNSEKNFFDYNFNQMPRYIKTNRDINFYDNKNRRKYISNLNENDFTLGGENKNIKIITRNKSNDLNNIQDNSGFNTLNSKNKYQNQDINREILNRLYENNFMNNSKKKDYQFNTNNNDNSNNRSNNKNKNKNNISNLKNNIIGLNTERKPNKKYSIFENDKYSINNNNNNKNKSRDYLYPIKQNNNEAPYNKIFNRGIISSSNFALINSQKEKDKIPFNNNKKINSSTSMHNNSHNSNSQSNNIGANHISTNYSIGPAGHSYYSSNKDSKQKINNSINNNKSKNENNKNNNLKPPISLQISSGIVDEYFKDRDSIGKKSSSNNNSNRISLQSLNDSKMLELAGHYGLGDDSSSDNYQMINVIHNKKKYLNNKNL